MGKMKKPKPSKINWGKFFLKPLTRKIWDLERKVANLYTELQFIRIDLQLNDVKKTKWPSKDYSS